jgi:adenylate kinase
MLNIILFGPPGAGKGTQSAKLVEKYGFNHLSTGDIFRAIKKSESPLATEVKNYIDKGELVPDELTIRVLQAEVDMNVHPVGFIFDGFPRTTAQAEALDLFLTGKNWKIDAMIALEVTDDELRKRLVLRGKESGRADDQDPEVIENRIKVYKRDTEPLKKFYEAQGKYRGVHGIGSVDQIFENLRSVIDSLK